MEIKLPPNTKPDSYWAAKETLDNEAEIEEWAIHDLNNFNNYPLEKHKAYLRTLPFHKDFICHTLGPDTKGVEAYISYIEMFFGAFSNLHVGVQNLIVKGDMLAIHYILSGKNTGKFMGKPPTNKEFTMKMMEFHKFAGGKFTEGWVVGDTAAFASQLGLLK
jgi:predicted ester cyclase